LVAQLEDGVSFLPDDQGVWGSCIERTVNSPLQTYGEVHCYRQSSVSTLVRAGDECYEEDDDEFKEVMWGL